MAAPSSTSRAQRAAGVWSSFSAWRRLSRDVKGRTPLHCCAEHGGETVAATLCEAKCGLVADVNEQDETGATALSIASRLGHVRLVRWLCHREELRPWDVDRYGVAALHKATSFGQLACVEALVADKRVRENIDQRVGRPTVPDEYVAKTGGEALIWRARIPIASTTRCTRRLQRCCCRRAPTRTRSTARGRTRATARPPLGMLEY